MLEDYRRNKRLDEFDEPEPELIVHATKLTKDNANNIAEMVESEVVPMVDPFDDKTSSVGININTPSGKKRLKEGDYLVVKGEDFFVIGPNQFEFKYTKIER